MEKTNVKTKGLTGCANMNRRSEYQSAFAYDHGTNSCGVMTMPGSVQFAGRFYENGAEAVNVYLSEERHNPGKIWKKPSKLISYLVSAANEEHKSQLTEL